MKTRIILFLAISAIITLSFTVVSVNKNTKKITTEETEKNTSTEPIGGFTSDSKI